MDSDSACKEKTSINMTSPLSVIYSKHKNVNPTRFEKLVNQRIESKAIYPAFLPQTEDRLNKCKQRSNVVWHPRPLKFHSDVITNHNGRLMSIDHEIAFRKTSIQKKIVTDRQRGIMNKCQLPDPRNSYQKDIVTARWHWIRQRVCAFAINVLVNIYTLHWFVCIVCRFDH